MELHEKIARGLRRRQIMPEQQGQRLVLAKLVEVFRPLTTGRPQRQQAFRHLRGAQTPLAALQLDLPVDHCRRPGLTKRLDQSGHSRMPGDQPRLKLAIDLEIQPCCHSIPPHPAVETYHPPRTKAESTTSLPDWANPEALAGDQGLRGRRRSRRAKPPRRCGAAVTGGGGRSHQGKMLVVGAVEVEDGGLGPGRIRLSQIADYSAASLHAFLAANLAARATAKTAGWPGYPHLAHTTRRTPVQTGRLLDAAATRPD